MPATAASPSLVIGYIRVSAEEQLLSVDAQRQVQWRWCQAHKAPLRAVYEDIGVSGGTPLENRPGLLQALQALTRDGLLLVVRRDRLARDTLTAALAERFAQHAGAHIVTVVPDLVRGMLVHPYSKETVQMFLRDAAKSQQLFAAAGTTPR